MIFSIRVYSRVNQDDCVIVVLVEERPGESHALARSGLMSINTSMLQNIFQVFSGKYIKNTVCNTNIYIDRKVYIVRTFVRYIK